MADDDNGTTSPAELAKKKCREALDRKKYGGGRTAVGRPNPGNVHGSEVTGGGKRTFRRKTG